MKIVLSLFFLLLGCMNLDAQEMSVKSFEERSKDLSASTYSRKDLNGTPCALIKVQLASSGAQFEGNVIGNVEYKTSEYWVYMPEGSKHLKVKPIQIRISFLRIAIVVHIVTMKIVYFALN